MALIKCQDTWLKWLDGNDIIIYNIITFIDLYCANINPGKGIFICALH